MVRVVEWEVRHPNAMISNFSYTSEIINKLQYSINNTFIVSNNFIDTIKVLFIL